MACGKVSWIINQGETFQRRIDYKDSLGLPIDLTYYDGRLYIKANPNDSNTICKLSSSMDSDGTGLDFTPYSGSVVLPLTSGSIGIYISAASSSNFTFSEAQGDLFIMSGSGTSQFRDKILDIRFKLQKSITTF